MLNRGQNIIAECFDTVWVRIDVKVQHCLPSSPSSLTKVFHGSTDEISVWYGYHSIHSSSNQCGSEIDLDYFAFRSTNNYPITDLERAVKQNSQCTKEIGNSILGSKGQC